MDWLYMLGGIFCFEIGAWYGRHSERVKSVINMKHVWQCPNRTCTFIIRGSAEIPKDLIQQHLESHIDD